MELILLMNTTRQNYAFCNFEYRHKNVYTLFGDHCSSLPRLTDVFHGIGI